MQDLRGMIIGHWTVLDAEPKRVDNGDFTYLCRCECGRERWVRASNLKRGTSTCCGCIRRPAVITKRDLEVNEEVVDKMTLMERNVVNLYLEGHSIAEIAKTVGRTKQPIRDILDRAGIDRTEVNKRAGVSEDKRQAIIRLYGNGEKQYAISKKLGVPNSTVRDVLIRAGLIQKKSYEDRLLHGVDYNESAVIHKKYKDAIKLIDILEKRASVHVGDEMYIPTMKTGGSRTKFQVVDPVARPAVVVNTDHPRFCIFRLAANGVMDCVNWVDLIMMDRLIASGEV